MTDTAPLAVLIDARQLAAMLSISVPTVWRMRDAGRLPEPLRLTAQCVRWRLRTGDPTTGVLDWIDAGCPPFNEQRPAAVNGEASVKHHTPAESQVTA